MKCCDHSLNAALQGLHGPFVVGCEIPCRSCNGYWRYEQKSSATMWIRHEDRQTNAFVTREANPIATVAREKAYERILGKERSR
jgi:hypothetical protein